MCRELFFIIVVVDVVVARRNLGRQRQSDVSCVVVVGLRVHGWSCLRLEEDITETCTFSCTCYLLLFSLPEQEDIAPSNTSIHQTLGACLSRTSSYHHGHGFVHGERENRDNGKVCR